jgi:hypothetical protein
MTDSAMSKILKGKEPKPKKMPSPPTEKDLAKSILTANQNKLPEGLKKKIIEAKKSGAGYSGD